MSVVANIIRAINWENKEILVACSGGLDSTVLLHALVTNGLYPTVLHINYQLRGKDSDADEQFVRQLTSIYGLKLEVHHCPRALLKGNGINLQAAAREFRRTFFRQWNQQSSNHFTILGHHSDDQLETFFLQLARGSGILGLGGMLVENDQMIRPFLSLSKDALLKYAQEHQLTWREDKSNAETDYLRNKLRNVILPFLETAIPHLKESTLFLQEKFRETVTSTVHSLSEKLTIWERDGELPVAVWKQLEPLEKQLVVNHFHWPFWFLARLDQLSDSQTSASVHSVKTTIFRTKSTFKWQLRTAFNSLWDFKQESIENLPQEFSKACIYLDLDKIVDCLVVAEVQPSAYVHPIGMKGKKTVNAILKDAGFSVQERTPCFALMDGTTILWIPGVMISRNAIATADSTRCVKIFQIDKTIDE